MKPKEPVTCGFCKDQGTHALLIFSTPANDTAVCSDCIEIFWQRVKEVRTDFIPRYTQTRQ